MAVMTVPYGGLTHTHGGLGVSRGLGGTRGDLGIPRGVWGGVGVHCLLYEPLLQIGHLADVTRPAAHIKYYLLFSPSAKSSLRQNGYRLRFLSFFFMLEQSTTEKSQESNNPQKANTNKASKRAQRKARRETDKKQRNITGGGKKHT